MDNATLIELSAAIRMTCANPEYADGNSPPLIVSFDGSDEAVACAGDGSRLKELAEGVHAGPVLEFPEGVAVTRMARSIGSSIRETGAAPAAVAVAGVGLFGVGRTRDEAERRRRCLLEGAPYQDGGEQPREDAEDFVKHGLRRAADT